MNGLNVKVDFVESQQAENYGNYHCVSKFISELGDLIGLTKFGEKKWGLKKYPSEEKLRIFMPPRVSEGNLEIQVTPYQWSDLQKHKQLHPIGQFSETDPFRYFLHGIALTGNGLIETSDGKLVFHYKKGGAAEGSIHTFGGYATRQDIGEWGIERTILRELSEKDEVGLALEEMEISALFATPSGMPATLWDFGTSAVYGIVKTKLSSGEIQERVNAKENGESLVKSLFAIPIEDAIKLENYPNIHPQTKQVVPSIIAIYK